MSYLAHRNVLCLRRLWFGFLGLCALGGCASSPRVEYFALAPIAAQGQSVASSSMAIQVAQVHLPPALDRKEIVRHSGAYTLDISDEHRWGAPLDEMIRRVLSQDLMQLMPAAVVVLPGAPAPAGTRKIVVNVLEFAPDASGMIHFQSTWSVIGAQPHGSIQNRKVKLAAPAQPNDITDQVRSMSDILGQLARSMASALAD